MSTPPTPMTDELELHEAARRFLDSATSHLPVVDATGTYLGVASAFDVMNALAADDRACVRALLTPTEPVRPDAPLGDALDRLDHGAGAVPVVDGSTGTVSGWVRHQDLLTALSRTPAEPPLTDVRRAPRPVRPSRRSRRPREAL